MKTISVNTGHPYQIHIGRGLLECIPKLLSPVCGARRPKLAVITDDRVDSLAFPDGRQPAQTLLTAFEKAGYSVCKFVFPNGEASKTLDTVRQAYAFFSEHEITRTDMVVAFGGGVVGDLAGFAAASWLRGVEFIQIPTTLLAMVDSSVGGKTGVDIPQGKNLVGAFWQPSLVVCDTDMLSLLPAETFADGMAEVIKYGAIFDRELFEQLERGGQALAGPGALEGIIARCVDLKRQVVEDDERDKGRRQLLNFGHTFGHAIEKQSDFTITHGHGVAIGMAMMARACERAGLAPAQTAARTACRPKRISRLKRSVSMRWATKSAPAATSRSSYCALSDRPRCTRRRQAAFLPLWREAANERCTHPSSRAARQACSAAVQVGGAPRADLRGALSDALPGISGRRLVRYAGNAPCAPGNGRKLDAGGKYGCL